MSKYIAEKVKEKIAMLPFTQFFNTNLILVPIPKSSLMKEDTMWVPQRLAKALLKNGLGIAAEEYLERVVALPKSATSQVKPTAIEHYNSLHVQTQKTLSEPKEILLIDDIVTRGATILGAANRLKEAFPKSRIRAFAAMRTMTPPYAYFKAVYDPCKGEIETRDGGQNTIRKR